MLKLTKVLAISVF